MNTGITTAIAFLAALAALHAAAFFLPPEFLWGVHHLRFLGPWHLAVYLAAAAALIGAGARGLLDAPADRLGELLRRRPGRFLLGALALFTAAGFLWRVDVPILGDSWYLVSNFAGAIRGTEAVLPRNEPLATYYLSLVVDLFDVKNYPAFLDAFFAGGMALGLGFVAVGWFIARRLFAEPRAQALAFLAVLALPAAALFFGYVETYGAVLFALALYVLTGLLFLGGRIPFGVVAVAFLLQVLTHYITVLTIPSLAWLAWTGARTGRGRDVAAGIALSSAAFLLILAAIDFEVTAYFSRVPHRHYLPFVIPDDPSEVYTTAYTLTSLYHAVDLANLALLVTAPAIALGLASLAFRKSATPRPRTPVEMFLLTAAAPVALFALVAKYDLGAARDWDIVAPFSLLFLLLALTALQRRAPAPAWGRTVAIVAGATFINSAAWWTLVGSERQTIDRFRSLMEPRLIGHVGMYNAHLYLSRYHHQAGDPPEVSAELWLGYINLYPGDIRGYRNVLNNTRHEGAAAAAEKIRGWSRAFGGNPLSDRTMVMLALERGNEAMERNRDQDAEHFYEAAIDVDPRRAPAWNNLGLVHARREEFDEAAALFSRAVALDSTFAEAWFNLGRALMAIGRSGEARSSFDRAAALGNRAARSLLSTGNVLP